MEINATQVWKEAKSKLIQMEIDPVIFNTYIKDAYIHSFTDGYCFIVVDSPFAKEVLSKNLYNQLEDVIASITGKKFKLKILEENEIQKDKVIKEHEFNDFNENLQKIGSKFSFDNFIKGPSNQQAFNASLAVALNLGTKWNPLFIYGHSGLGKTHLLYAIYNKIKEYYGDKVKTRFLAAEEFGKIFLDAAIKGSLEIEKFKNSFQNYDVLLIDDVQFLAKRTKTNETFFYVFNNFISNQKQIIMTSDKHPDELHGFEQRLLSRFQSGLSIALEPPGYETALKIIKAKIKALNYDLKLFEPAVLEFLALNFHSDVRKLEGALNRLIFFSIINNNEDSNKITLKEATEAFKNVPNIKQGFDKLTISKIKEVVADTYQIPVKLLVSRSRIANVTIARHLAMYLSRTLLDAPFTMIGTEFGGKDHSTVVSACKKIERLMKVDSKFKRLVTQLRKQLTVNNN